MAIYSFSTNKFCFRLKSILINVLGYGVKRHFQLYFSYIVAVSFIGGGIRTPE